jgi:hypothetical protein
MTVAHIDCHVIDKGVDENIVKEVLEKNTYTKVFSSVKTNYLQEKYLKTSSVYVVSFQAHDNSKYMYFVWSRIGTN